MVMHFGVAKKSAKIEKLTSNQIKQMAVYRDKYIQIGHSTGTDIQKAEEAINLAYRCANLAPPKKIVWCDSPLSLALTYSILLNLPATKELVNSAVKDSVWDSVRDSVRDSVGASVWDSVRDSVGASVWDSVGDSVLNTVLNRWWGLCIEGSHLAHWAGWYSYYIEVLGLSIPQGEGLRQMMETCGWVLPTRDICFVSYKPDVCKVKRRGNNPMNPYVLHAEGEPALLYRDGFAIYAYEGVRLPEHIGKVKPQEWEAKWVLESDRADMRALLASGMGPDRFIKGIGGKVISRSEHITNHSVEGQKTQVIELYEPDFSKFNPANKFRVLHLQCPSTRISHWHWVFPKRHQYTGAYGEKLAAAGVPEDIDTTVAAYQCMWHGKTPEEWAVEA